MLCSWPSSARRAEEEEEEERSQALHTAHTHAHTHTHTHTRTHHNVSPAVGLVDDPSDAGLDKRLRERYVAGVGGHGSPLLVRVLPAHRVLLLEHVQRHGADGAEVLVQPARWRALPRCLLIH